jgi:hypothetical protein
MIRNLLDFSGIDGDGFPVGQDIRTKQTILLLYILYHVKNRNSSNELGHEY